MTIDDQITPAPSTDDGSSFQKSLKWGLIGAIALLLFGCSSLFLYTNVVDDQPEVGDQSDLDTVLPIDDGDIDENDADIDGDGILDGSNPDRDGDGVPIGTDPDPESNGSIDFGPGDPGQCPADATGQYPACQCQAGKEYDPQSNDCVDDNLPDFGPGDPGQCPADATGQYPACQCQAGKEYDPQSNDCLPGIQPIEECVRVEINWPAATVQAGESAEVSWSFSPADCQLADEDAQLTLSSKVQTNPNIPAESAFASAAAQNVDLTLPCFNHQPRTLSYEMTGVDEAFGYNLGFIPSFTQSHPPAVFCNLGKGRAS